MPLTTTDERPTWIKKNFQRLFARFRKKSVDSCCYRMMFPVEIIEQILIKCDGQTLLNCRKVNYVFRKSVDYLVQKYPIWKWCCHEEIPQNELIEIIQKYDDLSDPDLWHNIYMNWLAWKSIKCNINFDIVTSATEIPRITCIAVAGGFIAVGSDDGRIRIYNENWDILYTERHFSVRVTSISFIFDEDRSFDGERPIFLVIAYNNLLVLEECQGWTAEPLILRDIKAHSVYKRFICYEKLGGRMTVTQLSMDGRGARLYEITFARIYSPSEVSCLRMWKGVCTFLINSEVKVLKYDPYIQPVHNVHNKTHIKFSWKDLSSDAMNCQIYRDDIIIGLSNNGKSLRNQFLELFILGSANNEYSKKLFNSWEILHSYITYTYLYGNTFIVGVDIGNVYFYHVSSWKTFDLRNYEHREILGKHPIIGIDVRETRRERRFYITSNVAVHEIVGLAMPDYICKLKAKEAGAKV